MKTIQIPQAGTSGQIGLEIEKNIVIVGANGSGKTRFGSKVEQINAPSKRISAQRHLDLSEVVAKLDYETADAQLKGSFKHQSPIQPQTDFQQVLVSLFAQESRRNEEYVANARTQVDKPEIPNSIKEAVVSVWQDIFPHRPLKLGRDRVRAMSEANEFSASEMSDGEKVGLYLISQVLLAEKDCVLIIDEPELHLHKALMVRLWNKLEEQRRDCFFVYITHDLDFAVSKPASKVLWIKSFKSDIWDWSELDQNEIIPENLFLEMLGSRKPILFVEGEKGSLDAQVYQTYYEEFTVIPRGSCTKVIESVRGLKENASLHNNKVFGLIDRDARSQDEIDALKIDGVFSIELNEVENLFLAPEILDIICEYQAKQDKKEEIISQIRDTYEAKKADVGFATSKYRAQRLLSESFGKIKSMDDFSTFKSNIIAQLDQLFVAKILPEKDADIVDILKVYPHKGLVGVVQGKLELTKNGYKNLLLSRLASGDRKKVVDALGIYLPKIL